MTEAGLPPLSGLERVRHGLRTKHPELRFTDSRNRITVHAPTESGFSISIGDDWVVGFDGWHEHFQNEKEAMECFAFGFSDQCRLRVEIRGTVDCKWTLEVRDRDQWVEDSTTGLMLFPFWRSARTVFRQNAMLKASEG